MARSGASVSLVTRPAHTRSHSASSSSVSSPGTNRRRELPEEQRAAASQHVEQALRQRRGLERRRLGEQERCFLGEREHEPSVVVPERAGAGPHQLPGGSELVEEHRCVARKARREDLRLQCRRGQRHTLELLDHAQERIEGGTARRRPAKALPCEPEARELLGRHRLDLPPERGERAAPQPSQDLDVDPLAPAATGPELAVDDAAVHLERAQGVLHDGHAEPEPSRRVGREKRPMGPREAGQQVGHRLRDRLEEGMRNPDGKRDAEPVAVARGVLDGDPALLAVDADAERAVRTRKRIEPRDDVRTLGRARSDLRRRQVTQLAQQVVQIVGVAQRPRAVEPLQLELERRPARSRRAARAAPRGPSARREATDRATAPARAARRAARRPRT